MSKHILCAFLTLAVTSLVYGGDVAMAKMDNSLAEILMMSSRDIERNPQLSAQCFAAYSPKIQKITDDYEKAYADCTNNADSATEFLNQEVQPNVTEVSRLQDDVCSNYVRCQSNFENNPYAFFDCSNIEAADAITSSYNIQTIAKDRMQYILLQQQLIKYTRDSCTDKCSNAYVEEAAKVHTELQDCLAGKIPIETSTTSTATPEPSTTPTTSTTTPEPTTSTTVEQTSTTDGFPIPPTVEV